MYNSIILSSCLFGSVNVFYKSLELINRTVLENRLVPYKLILLNGLTFCMSGFIFFYIVFNNNKCTFKYIKI